jgi:hypothetical protein
MPGVGLGNNRCAMALRQAQAILDVAHSWSRAILGPVPRLLALLMLLVVVVSAEGCGRAGKEGVQAGIEQIASISDEGALIAEGVARARTKTTFVRVHGDELSAQTEHEAQKLSDDSVAATLKPRIEKAIKLAADIGGAIDDLSVSPHDRRQAREDEAKLRVWAQQAAALAEAL